MTTSQAVDEACSARLHEILLKGDLSKGEGLVAGCHRADVETVLGHDGIEGRGHLSHVLHRWIKYPLPGKDTYARVWLGAADAVLLIDVKEPGIRETPDSLRKRLGEPAGIIAARVNPTNSEWLYPSRGITVAVGTRGDPEDAPDRITYLFLYGPTTMERYVDELGGKDEWIRRFPPRR